MSGGYFTCYSCRLVVSSGVGSVVRTLVFLSKVVAKVLHSHGYVIPGGCQGVARAWLWHHGWLQICVCLCMYLGLYVMSRRVNVTCFVTSFVDSNFFSIPPFISYEENK